MTSFISLTRLQQRCGVGTRRHTGRVWWHEKRCCSDVKRRQRRSFRTTVPPRLAALSASFGTVPAHRACVRGNGPDRRAHELGDPMIPEALKQLPRLPITGCASTPVVKVVNNRHVSEALDPHPYSSSPANCTLTSAIPAPLAPRLAWCIVSAAYADQHALLARDHTALTRSPASDGCFLPILGTAAPARRIIAPPWPTQAHSCPAAKATHGLGLGMSQTVLGLHSSAARDPACIQCWSY